MPLRFKIYINNPKSNLSYICKIGVLKNTITFDEGELHHGVHGQLFIGRK